MLYRALTGTLTPSEVDECELWQVGVLLGQDVDGTSAPRPGPAPSTPAPAQGRPPPGTGQARLRSVRTT